MKTLLLLALLALPAFGETFNSDLLPAQTGLSLGRQGQRWKGYFQNVDINGTITVNGAAGHFTLLPAFGSGHYATTTDLLTTNPGDCLIWLSGNKIGDAPCVTPVLPIVLGDCAVWVTTHSQTSLPCSGGGGSGDLKSLPVTTQTVTQPEGTSFNPNRMQHVHYATNYQWTQSPAGTISIGANTVTINGVLGVSAFSVSKVQHYLWIAAVGTPERVKITATTCTGVNTGTCTVTFTAANSHSAGYTLGTATAGWQEAWVDSISTSFSGGAIPNTTSKVAGSPDNNPSNVYVFNAPFDIDNNRGTTAPLIFDGQGSTIRCNTSGLACIEYGTGTAGTLGLEPLATTIENFLFMPVVGMGRTADGTTRIIHDHGQGLKLKDNGWGGTASTTDVFDNLVVVDDDESFVYENNVTNPGNGIPMFCDSSWCGAAIVGNPSAVGSFMNSDMQLFCRANAIDWSGNIASLSNLIIQSYPQFAIRFTAPFANFGMDITGVYEESACTNPIGTGYSGLIVRGGFANVHGGTGLGGRIPSFTASAAGATHFNYWVVPKSSTLGAGAALLAGYCLSNGTGTCTVKFPQIGSTGTMTWDLLRTVGDLGNTNIAPYTAITTGGAVATPGSVAVGITTASCATVGAGSVCTVVDDVTAATTAYTVLAPAFGPKIDQWPGAMISANRADGSPAANGILYLDQYGGDTVSGGIVSTAGRNNLTAFVQNCGPSMKAWQSIYINCRGITSVNSAVTPADIQILGPNPGTSRKGYKIFEGGAFNTAPAEDIITIWDSNPEATAASPGNRAASDPNDIAIGLDNANAVPANMRLGLRAPLGIRFSVGSIFDNSSWKVEISSTLVTSKVALLSPSYTTSSANGGLDGTEGTGAGLTKAVAHDLMWPDSTNHRWMMCLNSASCTSLMVAGIVASGTSTLTANAALAAVTSQAAITTAATGALTTDTIEWSFASAPTAGDSLCIIAPYTTAGNVNFVRTNPSAGAVNVSAIVVNWKVKR